MHQLHTIGWVTVIRWGWEVDVKVTKDKLVFIFIPYFMKMKIQFVTDKSQLESGGSINQTYDDIFGVWVINFDK